MKTLLPLALLALLFSGCREGSSDTLTLPTAPRPEGMPQHIDYQGERYTLRGWDGQNGEYYRAGEQGYEWKKLLTTTYSAQDGQLADFARAMEMQLTRENTLHDIQVKDGVLQISVLYPPQQGHPHFSGRESNIMRYQQLPCGIVGLHYAEQHPADSDAEQLFAAVRAQQPHFQKEAAAVLEPVGCP